MIFRRIFFLLVACCFFAGNAFAEPVARLLGQDVTLFELTPKADELKKMGLSPEVPQYHSYLRQMRSDRLFALVMERLTLDYAIENQLSAKEGDERVMSFLITFYPDDTEYTEEQKKIALRTLDKWLVDQALFNEFGGTVVFQQSNPLVPITAYKALIESAKKTGKLEIFDKKIEEELRKNVMPPYQFELSPDNVDYSKPWWNN